MFKYFDTLVPLIIKQFRAGHPLAENQNYPVCQCVHEDFIMPALGRDDDVAALLERLQIVPPILFSSLENYAAISMIESGVGMSIMNELITKDFLADIVMILLDPPQSITFGMVVPSLYNTSPVVKKFEEYVKQRRVREKYAHENNERGRSDEPSRF